MRLTNVLLISACLMLTACDPHMQSVKQDKTPPEAVISPAPAAPGTPVAEVPDASQTNTGNQVNSPRRQQG
jgi:outer membrane lipopolysaccharide assembly protein LptE/RlpB